MIVDSVIHFLRQVLAGSGGCRMLLGGLLLGLSLSAVAVAKTPAEVQSLIRADKLEAALDATEAELARNADNVEMRFLKGLILTRQDELDEAVKVFESLIKDHPKLPEPYNNLAVVYAARGEYDKARETLLKAINTHPSYATAYENIGDIYAKMASDAYNQALQLDTGNNAAREKLALVNDLFPTPMATPAVIRVADNPTTAGQQPAKQQPAAPGQAPAPEPEQKQARSDDVAPAKPTAEMPGPVMTQPQTAPAGQSAEDKPAEQKPAQPDNREIVQAVRDWAQAWSNQDVAAYLDAYADSFLPPAGMTRDEWRAQRRERVSAPEFIELDVDNIRINTLGNNHAQARFRQTYRSDTYGDEVVKTLLLKRSGDRWLIAEENSE